MTRRSTRTMTVLSQESLTTTPCRMRFGILNPLRPPSLHRLALHRLALHRLALLRLAAALAENSLDARDVAPHQAHPRSIFELPAGALETQVENLPAERVDLFGQLVDRPRPQVGGFHSLHG